MEKKDKRLVSFAVTQQQYEALQAESRRTGNAVSVVLRRLVDESLIQKNKNQ